MPILARALRDDVRHHAVDSDRRNRDAEEAEEAQQAHVDAALGYELREVVLERLDSRDRERARLVAYGFEM